MTNPIARYLGHLLDAWQASGVLGYLLVLVWLLYPVSVVTVFHPSDAVGFQLWLQGYAIPHLMNTRALNAGEFVAVLALVALSLLQLGIVTLIYRRTQELVHFWPLATFLVGGIANSIWWLKTGYFDPAGAMAGLTPLVAAVVCHGVCERLGASFVFGTNRPQQHGGAF
jgi:hypothetical protein